MESPLPPPIFDERDNTFIFGPLTFEYWQIYNKVALYIDRNHNIIVKETTRGNIVVVGQKDNTGQIISLSYHMKVILRELGLSIAE